MKLLPVLPILIPVFTAALTILFWKRMGITRFLSVSGSLLHLASALVLLENVRTGGIQFLTVGNWRAPFGIMIAADLFGTLMVVLAAVMGLVTVFPASEGVGAAREKSGFHTLIHILLMGVSGAFLTGDVFNLYVWFEVMLMASFVLLAFGGSRLELEGAIKYVTLNLISSAIFLIAAGLLYGIRGTLNMADLAFLASAGPESPLSLVLAVLFLTGFGIKAALFPLFSWLPASYHTPPVLVTALFSGLLTKAGVVALFRIFTLVFPAERVTLQPVLAVLAALTMVTGVLGAIAQYDSRRLLSFHIISQIGYLIMALAIGGRLAMAGAVFFLIHVVLAKAALFVISGIMEQRLGTFDLKTSGGLYRVAPGLSIVFLILGLSLAGLPPLSGFWAKLSLVKAGLDSGQGWLVAVALAVSLFTLFSMIKIWTEGFWKERPDGLGVAVAAERHPRTALALGFLTVLVLAVGLGAGPLFDLSLQAADQMLDRQEYTSIILGIGKP